MKNARFSKLLLLFLFIPLCLLLKGQGAMVVEPAPDNDVEKLILEKFVKQEDCIRISNIKTIGETTSIGSFSNGSSSIGIEEGIVFTTGQLSDVPGPNFSQGTSGQLTGLSDAPYLRNIVRNGQIFDAVGVEFDFESTFSFVSFTYVFASEEYCEYVGSEFNDAFGFFVSGSSINGTGYNNSVNIAKIPERNDVVSINNVNHNKNSNFFVDNLTERDALDCGIFAAPYSLQFIEFDGFTTRLQAFIQVVPCETYRLRLVVGDVSDDVLDSGVFLEGNSFSSTGLARVDAEVIGAEDNVVYEDCLEGRFVISRNKFSNPDEPLPIKYQISGGASNGVDYRALSGETVIPARQRQVFLPLDVIPDSLEESTESVKIVIETITCDCVKKDTAVLLIEDSKEDIDLFFSDPLVCAGQEFTLGPTILNPVKPLSYKWSNQEVTPEITDQIFQPTAYSITVSDACGATDSAYVEVGLQAVPEINIEGDFGWCAGREPETLNIEFPGQPPWELHYSIDGGASEIIKEITSTPFSFPFEQVGVYKFIGFNDRYCNGIVKGDAVQVDLLSFELEHLALPPSCPNANDGQIELSFKGGSEPFDIQWSVDGQTASALRDLVRGAYGVTVTDRLGCVKSDSITVRGAPASSICKIDLDASIYVPNAFSPNGDGVNDGFTLYPKFGLIQAASFQIYDRWGGLVYQSETISPESEASFWDGGAYPPGVYLCVIEAALSDGSIAQFGKNVSLIR